MRQMIVKINKEEELLYPAFGYILGVKNYSVCFEKSFDLDEIKNIRRRKLDKKIFVSLNRVIFNDVLDRLGDGDILVVTKLDRFCRTTKEGLQYIDSLMNKGVKIHILNMGLIEDTPMGRLIVTNLLAFAEFERAMIIERTQSGKAIAKTKAGFKEGRPKKYTVKQLDNALSMLTINGGDKSYNEVAELLGISKSTLIREVNKRKTIN